MLRYLIADGVPVEYVTRAKHPGIPKGSKVIALRQDGKLSFLYGEVRVDLDDRFYLEGIEAALLAEFMLAY